MICFSGLSTLFMSSRLPGLNRFQRESPRRILSAVDEPQPEPEPEPSIFSQFAKVDAGLLAWSFSLRDAREEEIAFIGREFRGLGREVCALTCSLSRILNAHLLFGKIFTDTGKPWTNK